MSEEDLRTLLEAFDRIDRECNTRDKAIAQLQREGLLDANGELPPQYRVPAENVVWQ